MSINSRLRARRFSREETEITRAYERAAEDEWAREDEPLLLVTERIDLGDGIVLQPAMRLRPEQVVSLGFYRASKRSQRRNGN